jgi:uncharacterized protein (DUF934 family)
MRYNNHETLRSHADRVSQGVAATQSQEGLDDQLKDLHILAVRFGLYDAADWLKDLVGYIEDHGELPSYIKMQAIA